MEFKQRHTTITNDKPIAKEDKITTIATAVEYYALVRVGMLYTSEKITIKDDKVIAKVRLAETTKAAASSILLSEAERSIDVKFI
jgi:hypothetical protein